MTERWAANLSSLTIITCRLIARLKGEVLASDSSASYQAPRLLAAHAPWDAYCATGRPQMSLYRWPIRTHCDAFRMSSRWHPRDRLQVRVTPRRTARFACVNSRLRHATLFWLLLLITDDYFVFVRINRLSSRNFNASLLRQCVNGARQQQSGFIKWQLFPQLHAPRLLIPQ